MKIHGIVALSLAVSSCGCLAFSSEPSIPPGENIDHPRPLEGPVLSNFYGPHSMVGLGRCDASPLPGCNCSFCAMLRPHHG